MASTSLANILLVGKAKAAPPLKGFQKANSLTLKQGPPNMMEFRCNIDYSHDSWVRSRCISNLGSWKLILSFLFLSLEDNGRQWHFHDTYGTIFNGEFRVLEMICVSLTHSEPAGVSPSFLQLGFSLTTCQHLRTQYNL